VVGILAKGVGSWYLENVQASMSGAAQAPITSLPEGFGIAFIVVLVIGLFGYAVQAIGLGQIALRRSSVGSRACRWRERRSQETCCRCW
jgi:ABC-type Na+ efflux pump permease subunit